MTQDAKPQSVWIIEMLSEFTGKWEPTVCCRLTKVEGSLDLERAQKRNPQKQFRLSKYERSGRVR